jgi:predicted SAM-dependent methyltransferase
LPFLHAEALEIGPFLNPLIYGNNVKYFDVLDLEHLKERAAKIGYPAVRPVPIDYVDPTGNLRNIPDKHAFGMVVGSHMLEHQLDIVRHLQAVQDLLKPGGYYAIIVPDKRYCFDHFIPESSIADFLDDYRTMRYFSRAHSLKSVIEHRALTTHNDAKKHWKKVATGNTLSERNDPDQTDRVLAAVREFEAAETNHEYVDVHNYQVSFLRAALSSTKKISVLQQYLLTAICFVSIAPVHARQSGKCRGDPL